MPSLGDLQENDVHYGATEITEEFLSFVRSGDYDRTKSHAPKSPKRLFPQMAEGFDLPVPPRQIKKNRSSLYPLCLW